jgi:hypothetical protein
MRPLADLGLETQTDREEDGALTIRLRSRALAYGVRIKAAAFYADDDCFALEPGHEQLVRLMPETAETRFAGATLTAINLQGAVSIPGKPS